MFQLSGYVPIRLVCFYNRRHLRVRSCKDCCFHIYASIKAFAVRVYLFKYCSFYMYASMKVTVVRICSYKGGMLL